MQAYEYRVVSAPRRGAKVKGARTPEDRFAGAVEAEMNRMAVEGWEYVRSDALPHEERPSWFARKVTVMRTLLVFRRPLTAAEPRLSAPVVPPPAPVMAPFPDLPPSRPAERVASAPLPPPRPAVRPVTPPVTVPPPAAPVPQAGFRRPVPQPTILPPEQSLEPPPLARPSSRLPLEDLLPTPEPGRGERAGE